MKIFHGSVANATPNELQHGCDWNSVVPPAHQLQQKSCSMIHQLEHVCLQCMDAASKTSGEWDCPTPDMSRLKGKLSGWSFSSPYTQHFPIAQNAVLPEANPSLLFLQLWLASRGLLMGATVPTEALVRPADLSLHLSLLHASCFMHNAKVDTYTHH